MDARTLASRGCYDLCMADRYTKKESEFGGDGSQPFPVEKGYTLTEWETLRKVYQTDPMDPEGGSDIVTQRAK